MPRTADSPRVLAPAADPVPWGSLLETPSTLAAEQVWTPQSRCFLPELHAAECQVASILARMAATPQQHINGGEDRIWKWLQKLQSEEGRLVHCHVFGMSGTIDSSQ